MKYKWFTATFLSLCLIPAVGMLVLPEQQAAGNEHLTPKPSLRNAQTGWNAEFLGDLTDYVADHFGFRQELVTANAALQTRLLCTSPAEDVIYGTDGWLYYAKTLDDYQNHATLTESEAQQLAQTVKSIQDYCESRGARFLFTIAPNKSSLYPEHMPARYLTEDADGSYERVLPYLGRELRRPVLRVPRTRERAVLQDRLALDEPRRRACTRLSDEHARSAAYIVHG